MKVDEILSGQLEQQIRDALEALRNVAPAGTHGSVGLRVWDDRGGSYVFATITPDAGGSDIAEAYGCHSIMQAAGRCIHQITSQEAMQKKRAELELEIVKLQAQLDALPKPEPAPEKLGELVQACEMPGNVREAVHAVMES